jgi:plastocyanin
MSVRKLFSFPLAAALGGVAAFALVAVVAASSSAAPAELELEVAQNCNRAEWPCWNPKGNPEGNVGFYEVAPFKIAQGGTISFEDNDSKAPTDVVWKGAAPSCTGVVEAPPTKTGWSGTCTFAGAGEYEFESTSLFDDGTSNYTKYKVIVEGPMGGGGGTTTTAGGGGGGTTTTGTTTTSKEQAQPGTTNTSSSGSGSATPTASLFVGSASSAVKLASIQRGRSVHGSVDVSPAAAGGRLEVQLLAARASLASAGYAARVVQVGRAVRSGLHPGATRFGVSLDAKARHALSVHGHLALSVKVVLTAAHGAVARITRSVVVRR